MRVQKVIPLLFLFIFLFSASSFAGRIPPVDSGVEYFYIFGPEGNPYFGAYTGDVTFYVDVAKDTNKDVTIKIINPGASIKLDDCYKDCVTETEFSIYGNELLDTRSFIQQDANKPTYQFGPYPANKGMPVGGKYRFKVVVKTLKGDDANLFALDVSPDESEVFTYGLPFRLSKTEGKEMYFYPTVPADTSYIIMRTYDIDPDGGIGYLYTGTRKHKTIDSASGAWSETKDPLSNAEAVSLKYVLTKKTQRHGNAVISALDDKGNQIPIYFRPPLKLASVSTQKETARSVAPKKRPIQETKKQKEKPVSVAKKSAAAPVAKKSIKFVPQAETKIGGRCDTFIFDAKESYDPNKRPLSFRWDFGDGASSDEPVVTHTYKKAGLYTVTLSVTNNTDLECNKDTKTQTIRVNFPPKPVFNVPEVSCVEKEVIFDATDTTGSEGTKLSYMWDFGDGATSQEAKAKHTYNKNGVYKVTLVVKDDSGTTCDTSSISRTIKINAAPIVKLDGKTVLCETDPDRPLEVTFDGSACSDPDNDALTYTWDFGDGKKGEGQIATHVYERGGNYTAHLTLTDDSNSNCNSASGIVEVSVNHAPKAVAGEDKNICATDEVTLDASKSYDRDRDELKYAWDLGDGTKKEGAKVNHHYAKGGRYNVALTVDDGRGSGCSESSSSLVVNANTSPFASLEAPKIACVGEQVSFDATGSHDLDGDNLTYIWNFGDGKEMKVGPLVTHRFDKGGKYNVSVSVDDGRKSPCSKAIAQAEIKINTPPVAVSGPNLVCCAGDIARFDGSRSSDADGDDLTYLWDFGDGGTGKGNKVTHEYKKSGTYTVVLTVKDNSGSKCDSSIAKFTAQVSESPVSVMKVKPKP